MSLPTVTIYTVIIGGYDDLATLPRESRFPTKYECLTDATPSETYGWSISKVARSSSMTATQENRLLKTHPDSLVLRTLVTVYIDGNITLRQPLDQFIIEFLESGADVGFFAHSDRHSVEAELRACVASGKIWDADAGMRQLTTYYEQGFSNDGPLLEGSVIFRRNDRDRVREFMSVWQNEIQRWNTRDQLSLPFALWKTQAQLHIFPNSSRRMYKQFHYRVHAGNQAGGSFPDAVVQSLIRFPRLLRVCSWFWRKVSAWT